MNIDRVFIVILEINTQRKILILFIYLKIICNGFSLFLSVFYNVSRKRLRSSSRKISFSHKMWIWTTVSCLISQDTISKTMFMCKSIRGSRFRPSFARILFRDPYKIQLMFKLKITEHRQQSTCPYFHRKIIFSFEEHFCLNKYKL